MSSMYSFLLYLLPLRRPGSAASVALSDLPLLPTMNAPSAAPPMMSSSIGWKSAARWPPAIAKPPNTAPMTIKYPRRTSMGGVRVGARPHCAPARDARHQRGGHVENVGIGSPNFNETAEKRVRRIGVTRSAGVER